MKTGKLVVMASGAGSTFKAIAVAAQSGELNAEVVGLVVSRDGVGAIDYAKEFGIPYAVLSPSAFANRELWDQALADQVAKWQPDLVALAGFTLLIGPRFLERFEMQVVNIHPSLLPKFGGQGMYGLKVHQAVLAAGESQTGITVHYVTGEYDRGPAVAQKFVPVEKNDSAESLAERVKDVEKEFYISVLEELFMRKAANKPTQQH